MRAKKLKVHFRINNVCGGKVYDNDNTKDRRKEMEIYNYKFPTLTVR